MASSNLAVDFILATHLTAAPHALRVAISSWANGLSARGHQVSISEEYKISGSQTALKHVFCSASAPDNPRLRSQVETSPTVVVTPWLDGPIRKDGLLKNISKKAHSVITFTMNDEAVIKNELQFSNVIEVGFGTEHIPPPSPTNSFSTKYQLTNFILYFGDITEQGLQQAFLKEIEGVELAVVFWGKIESPQCAEALLKTHRVAKTIIVEEVSDSIFFDAIRASRAVVDGDGTAATTLMGIEAAAIGRNVATLSAGALSTLFEEKVFPFSSAQKFSLRNALFAAYYGPTAPGLINTARAHTWSTGLDRVLDAYGLHTSAVVAPTSIPIQNETNPCQTILEQALQQFDREEIDAAANNFRLLRTNPETRCIAHHGLGLCALAQGQKDTAYRSLKLSLEGNPEPQVAMRLLTGLALELGLSSEIIPLLVAHLDTHPSDSALFRDLAELYLANNNRERATDAALKAWTFEPHHEDTQALMKLVL